MSQSSSAGDEAANLRDRFLIHFILLASQRGFVHTAAAARNRTAIFRARHRRLLAILRSGTGSVVDRTCGRARHGVWLAERAPTTQKSGCIVYPSDEEVLGKLAPVLEEAFETHLRRRRDWFAHDVVPPGAYEQVDVEDGVASALYVNLLTEDNLPYYSRTLLNLLGDEGVWGGWIRRWTAEEGQHSIVLRDWIRATGALDLDVLERGRMHQVCGGRVPEPPNVLEALTYVSFQEKATAVAHRNTGKALGNELGRSVMQKVAADEAHHYKLYCTLMGAGHELWPDAAMIAVWEQVRRFAMPGEGIEDFDAHSAAISDVGIFGAEQLLTEVFEPIVGEWGLETATGLGTDAERARSRIFRRFETVRRRA